MSKRKLSGKIFVYTSVSMGNGFTFYILDLFAEPNCFVAITNNLVVVMCNEFVGELIQNFNLLFPLQLWKALLSSPRIAAVRKRRFFQATLCCRNIPTVALAV